MNKKIKANIGVCCALMLSFSGLQLSAAAHPETRLSARKTSSSGVQVMQKKAVRKNITPGSVKGRSLALKKRVASKGAKTAKKETKPSLKKHSALKRAKKEKKETKSTLRIKLANAKARLADEKAAHKETSNNLEYRKLLLNANPLISAVRSFIMDFSGKTGVMDKHISSLKTKRKTLHEVAKPRLIQHMVENDGMYEDQAREEVNRYSAFRLADEFANRFGEEDELAEKLQESSEELESAQVGRGMLKTVELVQKILSS